MPEITLGGERTVTVRVTRSDATDIVENQPMIDGAPLVESESEYPMVVEGAFDSRGDFLIFATHRSGDAQLEYDEFVSALQKTA